MARRLKGTKAQLIAAIKRLGVTPPRDYTVEQLEDLNLHLLQPDKYKDPRKDGD